MKISDVSMHTCALIVEVIIAISPSTSSDMQHDIYVILT